MHCASTRILYNHWKINKYLKRQTEGDLPANQTVGNSNNMEQQQYFVR